MDARLRDGIEQAFEHSQGLKDWAEQVQEGPQAPGPNIAADGEQSTANDSAQRQGSEPMSKPSL